MGTLSLAVPLVLFEKSRLRAGTGFHLLTSFRHHLKKRNYTTQTVTHTVTLTSTFSRTLYRYSSHNVVCPSGAWFENRPHSTPSYPPCVEPEARNSAVGWHWNTHLFDLYLWKFALFSVVFFLNLWISFKVISLKITLFTFLWGF